MFFWGVIVVNCKESISEDCSGMFWRRVFVFGFFNFFVYRTFLVLV